MHNCNWRIDLRINKEYFFKMALTEENKRFRRHIVELLKVAEQSVNPSVIAAQSGWGADNNALSRYSRFKSMLYGPPTEVLKLENWLKDNGHWRGVTPEETQRLSGKTPMTAVLMPAISGALRKLADALDDPNIPLDTKARWLRQEVEFLARALPDESVERVVHERTQSGQQVGSPSKTTGQKQ